MKHRYKICLILLLTLGFCALLNSCIRPPKKKPGIGRKIPKKYWVRVCLYRNIFECRLDVPGEFEVSDSINSITLQKTDVPITVKLVNGKIQFGQNIYDTQSIKITPSEDVIFSINKKRYRGSIEFIVSDDKKSFSAINHLSSEAYLYGVVAAEMPSYWEHDALKTQAIAARTYCFYIKSKFGQNRNWDLRATQANQVYKGIAAETARTRLAVDDTYGMVLTSTDSDAPDNLIPAYYSSICGGHTEDSYNVFGDSFGPLKGVECPYCQQITRPSLFQWPMVKFNKAAAEKKLIAKYPSLEKLGKIVKVIPAIEKEYDDFKRIVRIKLIGSNGKSDILRAEDFRLTVDSTGAKIKSTIYQMVVFDGNYVFVSGRGFGHGVGLCQYGARQMAKNGNDYKQILSYYYPGSKIKTLY